MNKLLTSILLLSVQFTFGQSKVQQALQTDSLEAGIQDLCWSPDGNSIYFSGMWHKHDYSDFKPEKWSIYKYNFTNKTTIKFIDSAYYVTVSPSGNQIATGKIIDGNRDLYIYDSDGKNPIRITSHPKADYIASFSPDGKKILFNSARNGKPDIYFVNTDSTGLKRLTFSSSDSSCNSPQWSPDGKKIVFYLGTPKRKDQLYVMETDGSNAKNITNDTLQNFFPSWINNNEIIYAQEKNGINQIFTISPDGNNKKQFFQIESFYARISPNGKMIAYVDSKEQCIKVASLKIELIEKIFLPFYN